MKKMIFGAALLSTLLLGEAVNAQSVSGRISVPGFSLRVSNNNRTGYGHGYGHGDYRERQIAMQQDRIHDLKRMAWSDGYLSFRERRMIAIEEDRLNELMANGRYQNRW
jgi:hypothetical protein